MSAMSKSNMSLPLDTIAEILSWLPVDAIVRFTCVCKSWHSLITHPQFINLHLSHSVRTTPKPNNNHGMLLFEQQPRYENGTLSLAPFSGDAVSPNTVKIPYPFRDGRVHTCHCDGLVFATTYWASVSVLCNPLLRKQKPLTLPRFEGRGFPGSVILVNFAFGVDISSGDHKIVRVVLYADWEKNNYFWNHNLWTSEVKVFSFGSNSWTRVPDLPFSDLKLCTPSVHLNGAVHWLVCDRDYYYSSESLRFVIAFDLASYEFHTLPVPNNILERGRSGTMMSSCLIVLDGCLCLCVSDRAKATQEVWMMKEYGVHESWCRLFIFENCELPCRPLVLSKTNNKVLMEQGSKRLFWYDYISGGIEGVEISGMPFAFNTTVCVGSLLLLDCDPIQAAQL